MLVSAWKSDEEIRQSLAEKQNIAVFSCNICANLNGTGGRRGLQKMKRLLKQWGKTITVARTVNVCCSEEIMRQKLRLYIDPVRDRCDALVMLSCAGGVKCAFLCRPGIPVVAALDSTGSGVVATSMSPAEAGLCVTCGHCVLTYTGGICPLAACPARRKYGPCKKAPAEGGACALDPDRDCVWKEIEKKGDMAALAGLARLHADPAYTRSAPIDPGSRPRLIRRFSGWFMARIPGLSGLVDLVK
ncbi:MAG: methylenetetrahydrofolate reductase C-terminal domain-containing protein [Desulfosudaceae bacterium]